MMDEAIRLYKEIIQYGDTASATVTTGQGDNLVIETVQTQRDLERAEKVKLAKSYFVESVKGEFSVKFESSPRELNNEIWSCASKSGKLRAVIRKVTDKKKDEKFYLEIWNKTVKTRNIDLLAADKHGKVYDNDGCFGCLEWAENEDKLLYIAEKKYKKATSFFTKQAKDGEKKDESVQDVDCSFYVIPFHGWLGAAAVTGEEYVFKEEWGEGLVGKHWPVLCVVSLQSEEVSVLDSVPDNISPALARWGPGDAGIVYTGWEHEPYRLGLIYCPMRKSAIYNLDLSSGKCEPLSVSPKCSRSCVLSLDQGSLVYLQSECSGPHMQCAALIKYDLKAKENKTVIDVVGCAKNNGFPGIYCVNLPAKCWCSDGVRIVVNSVWRSKDVILVVNTETGAVDRLPTVEDCCMSLLCIQDDVIVAKATSPVRPSYLLVGRLPSSGQESSMQWRPLAAENRVIPGLAWKVFTHSPTPDRVNKEYEHLDYESILIYPTDQQPNERRKFIAFPHGGPHSVFTSTFQLYVTCLAKLGYSSLMVNYRGSIGFGNDSIFSLLGKCGDQDVKDVQAAVVEVLEKEGYNRDSVCIWGGSHGGFLTCHLVGQYPGFYKAAVSRNPVINVASKGENSDFPDGCYTEAGFEFDYTTIPSATTLETMWKCSPLQYVDQITTPVMLMIGQDDKRVPTKQSYEMYKALKSRNKPVRYISYPENGHPIVKVDSEADAFINIYKWFEEHTQA